MIIEAEIGEGQRQQQIILKALATLSGQGVVKNRDAFSNQMRTAFRKVGLKISTPLFKTIIMALAERDDKADICTDNEGHPEPDPVLRDFENVPLLEEIKEYIAREILPHVPDAWVDKEKTKIGYEINFNRYFYKYTPLRPLEDIEADLKQIEKKIADKLAEMME